MGEGAASHCHAYEVEDLQACCQEPDELPRHITSSSASILFPLADEPSQLS